MRCSECGYDLSKRDTACPNCGDRPEPDSESRFKAAMDCVANNDLEGAIDLLERCIEAEPEHLAGRYNLGVALSLADRCDEAIGHLYYVLTADGGYPGIYTALGEAAFGSYLQHEEQASMKSVAMIELFKHAIEQDKQDVDAYFSLGNAYIALGMGEEALACLKTAMTLDPESSAIYYVMARAYMITSSFGEAKLMARKALDLAAPSDQFLGDIENLLTEIQR